MKFGTLLATAAGALVASAITASALTYASNVDDVTAGTGVGTPGRDDPNNTLGTEDGVFYALGLGGQIVLSFGELFTGPASIWEVTFGGGSSYSEAIDLEIGSGGAFTYIATISNSAASGASGAIVDLSLFDLSIDYDQIRITDVTLRENPGSLSKDGFDVDAVAVTPVTTVPLPASALLLGAAVAGLGFARRKTA